MADDLSRLTAEQLREALQLLGRGTPRGGVGRDLPSARSSASRALREALATPGFVRRHLEQGPPRARDAFVTLAGSGPQSVESLLGRGWWGRGLLPPPLDWLQRRALVVVDDDGLVRAVAAAVEGWRAQSLRLVQDDDAATGRPTQPRLQLVEAAVGDPAAGDDESGDAGAHVPAGTASRREAAAAGPRDGEPDLPRRRPLVIEPAGSVIIAEHPEDIGRAIAVPSAGLKEVAPTVAISRLRPDALADALRAAGVPLQSDAQVRSRFHAPALPGSTERAVTPWDLRDLFSRALEEGRQLHLTYYPSSRGGAATERTVDPWRFTDDLLVGWCHLRAGERTFALDRIGGATLLGTPLEHRPEGATTSAPPDEPL